MNKPIEIVLNAATIEYVTATWKDLLKCCWWNCNN